MLPHFAQNQKLYLLFTKVLYFDMKEQKKCFKIGMYTCVWNQKIEVIYNSYIYIYCY